MLSGIDVSEYQTTTPSLTGLSFVFARQCYGSHPDARYGMHGANVRKAGLLLGAYAFGRSSSIDPVAGQVQALLAATPAPDLYVLDLESDGTSPAMTDAEAKLFIGAMHKAGRRCGLYHSLSGYPTTTLGQDFDWVAAYISSPPTRHWDFWQYRGSPLDLDRFAGDKLALYTLAGVSLMRVFTVTGPSGTATVGADPAIRLVNLDGVGGYFDPPAGAVYQNALPIHLAQRIPGGLATDNRQDGYLVVADGKDYVLLAKDASFAALSTLAVPQGAKSATVTFS